MIASRLLWVLTVGYLFLYEAGSCQAVTVGFLSDFEDNTIQSWTNGSSGPDPLNINTGGPLGVNDNFLQITADGSGSVGKLTSFSTSSNWLGNYISAGVTAIEMDLKNFGTTALSIRIAFKTGSSGYSTTTGFALAADNSWHHASFAVSAAAMTGISGPGTFNTFMTNPGQMRILHSASPSLNGDTLVSQLGVDNIRAVPESGMALLSMLTGACLLLRRKR